MERYVHQELLNAKSFHFDFISFFNSFVCSKSTVTKKMATGTFGGIILSVRDLTSSKTSNLAYKMLLVQRLI